MNRRPALTLLAALAAAGTVPLRAQVPWVASYYPYVVKGPNDKLSIVLHYHYAQNADYDQPVPFAGSFSAEGGWNADGSLFGVARFKAPLLVEGWRFYGEAGAVHETRYGYFGLGNDTEKTDDPANRYLNRARRTRYYAQGDVTKSLEGPVSLVAGVGVVNAKYTTLPGQSELGYECTPVQPGPFHRGRPLDSSFCEADTDVYGRLAVVVDTRDVEFVTLRGVMLEAGAYWGSGGGGDGYGGVYGIAKGFASPREGTVLAARLAGRVLGGDPSLDARHRLPAWERTIDVLGGPESHRSFVYGRYTGRDLLLLNAEVRQDILNLGDYGALSALVFFDAGSVSEWSGDAAADASYDSATLHLGGGGGLVLRILRSTVLTFNFAGGGDGFLFSMGTGWAF